MPKNVRLEHVAGVGHPQQRIQVFIDDVNVGALCDTLVNFPLQRKFLVTADDDFPVDDEFPENPIPWKTVRKMSGRHTRSGQPRHMICTGFDEAGKGVFEEMSSLDEIPREVPDIESEAYAVGAAACDLICSLMEQLNQIPAELRDGSYEDKQVAIAVALRRQENRIAQRVEAALSLDDGTGE